MSPSIFFAESTSAIRRLIYSGLISAEEGTNALTELWTADERLAHRAEDKHIDWVRLSRSDSPGLMLWSRRWFAGSHKVAKDLFHLFRIGDDGQDPHGGNVR